jgi:hypothetical protein
MGGTSSTSVHSKCTEVLEVPIKAQSGQDAQFSQQNYLNVPKA